MSITKKLLLILSLVLSQSPAIANNKNTNIDDFQFLEFSEIQTLFRTIEPEPATVAKLSKTLNTVFYKLNNKILIKRFPYDSKLQHHFLKIAHWNLDGVQDLNEVQLPMELIKANDIFILNGVTWGSPETNYRNMAEDFAQTVGGEYIYVAEFLEMHPELMEYSAKKTYNNPYLVDLRNQATNFKLGIKLDLRDFKGLHGNAIVSKFPIKASRIVRLPACYDWFKEEAKLLNLPKKERIRKPAEDRLGEGIVEEMRRGGRVALIADIALNPTNEVTVISVQLENRADPECREEQMQYLLTEIQNIRNPIILGADLNNFEGNSAPTTFQEVVVDTVTDPEVLAGKVVSTFNPFALPTTIFSYTVGGYRKKNDPTVAHVPIILKNKSAGLFKTISNFKFSDGNSFDFSGDSNLNYNRTSKRLANSNERAGKGFVETYQSKKLIGMGKYKTDWIFVKPIAGNYFPANAQTFNIGPAHLHSPISVEVMILNTHVL